MSEGSRVGVNHINTCNVSRSLGGNQECKQVANGDTPFLCCIENDLNILIINF